MNTMLVSSRVAYIAYHNMKEIELETAEYPITWALYPCSSA
jgi:hypothetical protein